MTADYRSANASSFYYGNATVTLAKPSGVVEGDVLLAVLVNDDGTRVLSTYTGWTLAETQTETGATGGGMWCLWKKAGASEPASYDFVFNYSFNGSANIIAFSDGNTVNVIDSGAWTAVDSASPYTSTAPTVTSTEDGCLLVAVNCARITTAGAVTYTAPSGYTSRLEAKSTYDARMFAVATKSQASAGASGTAAGEFAISGGGDGRTCGVHLAISPASSTYIARPTSDVSAGTWTASTGSDLYAMIDESVASDSDYCVASSAGTMEVALGSLSEPPAGWVTTVRFRINGDVTVSLREGASTEIASWVKSAASATTYEEELSGGQQSSISDWTDLRLRFVKA